MAEMEKRVEEYKGILKLPFFEPAFDQLLEILRGGKRIRPYLLQLGFGVVQDSKDERSEALMKAALGLECFHAFALVHDDIMDKSERRRGMVTVHEFIRRQLETEARAGSLVDDANAQAMLIGDLLHAWASELMAEVQIPGVAEEYRMLVLEVVAGQMMDVDFTTRLVTSEELVERKNHLKTSSYTFVRPVRLGLKIAGAADGWLKAYSDIASTLGDAFQLQDDYLDIYGATDVTGKGSMRDIEEGQQTFFTAHVLMHGTEQDRALLKSVLGNPIVGREEEVRELFERTGAAQTARDQLVKAFDSVEEQLQQLKPANLEDWIALVEFLKRRSH